MLIVFLIHLSKLFQLLVSWLGMETVVRFYPSSSTLRREYLHVAKSVQFMIATSYLVSSNITWVCVSALEFWGRHYVYIKDNQSPNSSRKWDRVVLSQFKGKIQDQWTKSPEIVLEAANIFSKCINSFAAAAVLQNMYSGITTGKVQYVATTGRFHKK